MKQKIKRKEHPYVKKQPFKVGEDVKTFRREPEEVEDCSKDIVGIIQNVGIDFVELIRRDHTIISIPMNRIENVEWLEKKVFSRFDDCDKVDTCPHCNQKECKCIEKKVLNPRPCNCRHKSHCNCQKNFIRFQDCVIPFCDKRVELRLGGLTDNLKFELYRHKGSKVKLHVL
ncbi:hypothetical protein [Priestia filamentosa]|uniref:Uncharacterized protein n=1 Tax=Priestia filamentosa TaxID=1402861 RepID=A0A1X7ECC1_9BACI|nr:hypothetical protein [Priestia filamentosa]AKO92765.1 hypothetical protein BEH_12100 [Priestia filamentosa]MDT3762797.1 hypothetical protein [Priestia filamentosa]OXS69331.1 hypothetical protein B1B01_10170 [Priestia filamentosa]RJS63954.1 hypothetical protein CJ485_04105 [Priestia filamentosa]WCM13896.1 hypothetical protein PGN40_11035 [Priestia filamentosa]